MKIIFLDIDGVLNSTRSVLAKHVGHTEEQENALLALYELIPKEDMPYLVEYTYNTIDPIAMGLINRAMEKDHKLRVALSTSHRTLFDDLHSNPMLCLQIYLKALGFTHQFGLIGVTPTLPGRRGLEVKEFLSSYADKYPNNPITHHVAIDDSTDFDIEDCTYLRIDPELGLTAQDYYEMTRLLDIKESSIIF